MVGNLREWTEDCWDGDCGLRVMRGVSWLSPAVAQQHPGTLFIYLAGLRYYENGFRVSRTLD